jgi:hypothetical protein
LPGSAAAKENVMKRKPHEASRTSSGKTRMIEPRRLAEVRGGAGLGANVSSGIVAEDYISPQHNEALIRL